MTVQELINKLILLDLDKEILIEDTLETCIGDFNIIENDKDIVLTPNGEWSRMAK